MQSELAEEMDSPSSPLFFGLVGWVSCLPLGLASTVCGSGS